MTKIERSEEWWMKKAASEETDEQFLDSMEQWVMGSLVFKREHRERLFALARRGAAMQWRPIEEAPKDGTQFLALLSNGWYSLLRYPRGWQDDRYLWWIGNENPPVVETHLANTDWSETHTILATHWMPLPPPPSGEPSDGK